MSIFSRLAVRHLDDSAFAEIWASAAAEGHGEPHAHLQACAQCRARYAAFTGWLDDLRVEAHAEADEAFPAERLAAQQSAIFRRLEALERPARVIAFPKLSRPVTSSPRVTHRWVATAAAAGLVIGLAAGQVLDLKRALDGAPIEPQRNQVVAGNTPSARPPQVQPANLAADEALFYGDGDATARYMPVLDELVPRARDEFDRNR